ncbi:ubiquinol-cytochrome-c reductase complex assembly factor 1 [Patella vulgata]|uniref:ubiquinol-cytochrome-c reductase complex assembly factor 1 n=1 Tax=Patella vulgata TaxID=6465 RepID=UPI00217F8878|nr:ubiquinol-cytochrome-c reductase complex assembly factor 1 [Patella vulgata]
MNVLGWSKFSLRRLNFVCSNLSQRSLHTLNPVLQIQPLEARLKPSSQSLLQFTPLVCSTCSTRFLQTASAENSSMWSKVKNKILGPELTIPKRSLALAGYKMYICITDQLDLEEFVKEINLPDTFNSWVILLDLHVWICMVRLSNMGEEGKILRQNLVQAMWQDIQKRGKQLGKEVPGGTQRRALQHYNDMLRAYLFNLDEGLLGDDRVLAGSVWRTVFEKQQVDPEVLALMVHYIRKQIHHVEKQESNLIMSQGLITFLPLHGETENKDLRTKLITKLFNQRVML